MERINYNSLSMSSSEIEAPKATNASLHLVWSNSPLLTKSNMHVPMFMNYKAFLNPCIIVWPYFAKVKINTSAAH